MKRPAKRKTARRKPLVVKSPWVGQELTASATVCIASTIMDVGHQRPRTSVSIEYLDGKVRCSFDLPDHISIGYLLRWLNHDEEDPDY